MICFNSINCGTEEGTFTIGASSTFASSTFAAAPRFARPPPFEAGDFLPTLTVLLDFFFSFSPFSVSVFASASVSFFFSSSFLPPSSFSPGVSFVFSFSCFSFIFFVISNERFNALSLFAFARFVVFIPSSSSSSRSFVGVVSFPPSLSFVSLLFLFFLSSKSSSFPVKAPSVDDFFTNVFFFFFIFDGVGASFFAVGASSFGPLSSFASSSSPVARFADAFVRGMWPFSKSRFGVKLENWGI